MILHAQTNDLSAAPAKGACSRRRPTAIRAAISNYQSLATQFDRTGQIAATAIFRLGECYRQARPTNDAVVHTSASSRIFRPADIATFEPAKSTGWASHPNPVSGRLQDHCEEPAGFGCRND